MNGLKLYDRLKPLRDADADDIRDEISVMLARLPINGAEEYLRRNDEYCHNFQTIALTGGPSGRDLEAFADRWGLRFPMRSRRAA